MAHKFFEIDSQADLGFIAEYLDNAYEPQFVIDQLKEGLDPRCKNILLEIYYKSSCK